MRYNVAQLLKEPIGSTRTYQLEETFTRPHGYPGSASGPVHILRTHHGLLVKAALKTRSTLMCGRCLAEFASESELHLEEEFFPTVNLQTGRGVSAPPDVEEGMLIDSSHVLDLAGTIWEYIVADLPMKPLCSHDCAGLCQFCGVNLNENDCECASQVGDSRWIPLSGLVEEQEV